MIVVTLLEVYEKLRYIIYFDKHIQQNDRKGLNNIVIRMSLYVVDRILDKRISRGRIEYKVKWEGYSEAECTWQPPQNLSTIKPMIQEFNAKFSKNNSKAPSFSRNSKLKQAQTIDEQDDFYQQEEEVKPSRSKNNLMYEQKLSEIEEKPEGQDEEFTDAQQNEFVEQEQQGQEDVIQPQQQYEQEEQDLEEFAPEKRKYVKKESKMSQSSSKIKNKNAAFQEQVFQINEQSVNPFSNQSQSNHQLNDQKKAQIQKKKGPKNSLNPQLESITNNMRFISRPPPPDSSKSNHGYAQNLAPLQVKIKSMSQDSQGKKVFIVQDGPLTYALTHDQMLNNYIDALIRFYESKIEFVKIPRLPK